MQKPILLWRAIMQLLGGIGVVIFAFVILPAFKMGIGFLLTSESSSDAARRDTYTIAAFIKQIILVYSFFTLVCCFCYILFGMSVFDAICHAFATTSSGGLSTHDSSFIYFNNIRLEAIASIFMLLSAMPFFVHISLFKLKKVPNLSQITFFLALTTICIALFVYSLISQRSLDVFDSLRFSIFSVISIVSSTGFVSIDYTKISSFVVMLCFLLMIIGGCVGSTSGGLKIFRVQVVLITVKNQLSKILSPRSAVQAKKDNVVISDDIIRYVLCLASLYFFSLWVGAVILCSNGHDFLTSVSSMVGMLSNAGPGLTDISGPVSTYVSFGLIEKIVFIVAMLCGRLEFLAIYILFMPNFWRS